MVFATGFSCNLRFACDILSALFLLGFVLWQGRQAGFTPLVSVKFQAVSKTMGCETAPGAKIRPEKLRKNT